MHKIPITSTNIYPQRPKRENRLISIRGECTELASHEKVLFLTPLAQPRSYLSKDLVFTRL
jgi:hypothetical protein